jgi:hypothetical protein
MTAERVIARNQINPWWELERATLELGVLGGRGALPV